MCHSQDDLTFDTDTGPTEHEENGRLVVSFLLNDMTTCYHEVMVLLVPDHNVSPTSLLIQNTRPNFTKGVLRSNFRMGVAIPNKSL